jgi:sugar-specific transcriptional regulator TrmB
MKSNILSQSLEQIGLEPLEIILYEKLLLIDKLNVSDLARDLAVDRRKIYAALENLELKNLFTLGKNGKFTIEAPTTVSSMLMDREIKMKQVKDTLDKTMPQIMANYYTNKTSPLVKIYEGKTQFLNLFNSILENKNEILSFGNQENFFEFVDFDYFQVWKKKRIAKGIKSRDLTYSNYYSNQLSKRNVIELREVKFIPKDFLCESVWSVTDNQFLIWNPIIPKVIVIEDPIIVEMMRMTFELIWQLIP